AMPNALWARTMPARETAQVGPEEYAVHPVSNRFRSPLRLDEMSTPGPLVSGESTGTCERLVHVADVHGMEPSASRNPEAASRAIQCGFGPPRDRVGPRDRPLYYREVYRSIDPAQRYRDA
ncbi:MAG TPA: hypothetical protein VKT21_01830, partial [Thermoplasmata archaeon]|nr:hypothetical protein [Thermoplasmata archaeon]